MNTPIDSGALLRRSIETKNKEIEARQKRLEKLQEEINTLTIGVLALEEAVKVIENQEATV